MSSLSSSSHSSYSPLIHRFIEKKLCPSLSMEEMDQRDYQQDQEVSGEEMEAKRTKKGNNHHNNNDDEDDEYEDVEIEGNEDDEDEELMIERPSGRRRRRRSSPRNRRGRRRSSSATKESSGGETQYTVERILESYDEDGELLYLCKWKNFPRSESTWEPAENLYDNCQNLIDEFHRAKKNAEKRKPTTAALIASTPSPSPPSATNPLAKRRKGGGGEEGEEDEGGGKEKREKDPDKHLEEFIDECKRQKNNVCDLLLISDSGSLLPSESTILKYTGSRNISYRDLLLARFNILYHLFIAPSDSSFRHFLPSLINKCHIMRWLTLMLRDGFSVDKLHIHDDPQSIIREYQAAQQLIFLILLIFSRIHSHDKTIFPLLFSRQSSSSSSSMSSSSAAASASASPLPPPSPSPSLSPSSRFSVGIRSIPSAKKWPRDLLDSIYLLSHYSMKKIIRSIANLLWEAWQRTGINMGGEYHKSIIKPLVSLAEKMTEKEEIEEGGGIGLSDDIITVYQSMQKELQRLIK